jgi:hypothetical protein
MPTSGGLKHDNTIVGSGVGSLIVSSATLPVSPILESQVVPANASAATAAGAQITATIPATVGVFSYLTGVYIGLGAGTTGTVTATIAGVNGGPLNFATTLATAGDNQQTLTFNPPLISSALNTAITVTLPAVGGVSAVNTLTITGYVG